MQCHALFEPGGNVGPDITGANRGDLNYVLENVVDPNAVIPVDYAASVAETKDGRVVLGIVKKQDATAVTVVTNTETVVLPRAEVKSLRATKVSMMPEGLLDAMSEADVRDLIGYLRSPSQVPLKTAATGSAPEPAKSPAEAAAAAKAFFNGKDLTGWEGNKDVWSVRDGELVGRTERGLKANDFLRNTLRVADFRLVVKAKLVPDSANSGIQFRSEPIEGGEMRGCQADMGAGWWGKLYEESARGLLWDKDHAALVNKEGWNTYEILAVGSKVRTALNGHPCADLDDPKIARSGLIAVQVHSGGPTEVRFKDFELELNPAEFKLKTVK
jgi:putative heme-binding domain-containing protein